MKRVRRFLFHVAALVSLVLCVVSGGLYLRRPYESDTWTTTRTTIDSPGDATTGTPAVVTSRDWAVICGGGGVSVQRAVARTAVTADEFVMPVRANRSHYEAGMPIRYPSVTFAIPKQNNPGERLYFLSWGFGLAHSWFATGSGAFTYRWDTVAAVAPLWFFAALFAILPVIWEVRYRKLIFRRLRERRGLCPSCGYDLRASPERCPECGCEPGARRGAEAQPVVIDARLHPLPLRERGQGADEPGARQSVG